MLEWWCRTCTRYSRWSLFTIFVSGVKTLETWFFSIVFLKVFRASRRVRLESKKVTSVGLAVLRERSGTLARVEVSYPALVSNVDFVRKENTAQLNGLYTKEKLQGMINGRSCNAVDSVFAFVATFIDKTFRFCEEIRLDLSGRVVQRNNEQGVFQSEGRRVLEK